jgi:hypothetical protein
MLLRPLENSRTDLPGKSGICSVSIYLGNGSERLIVFIRERHIYETRIDRGKQGGSQAFGDALGRRSRPDAGEHGKSDGVSKRRIDCPLGHRISATFSGHLSGLS